MNALSNPNILTFDLETRPLMAYIWDCGEQFVGHKQLVEGYDQFEIICAAYAWNDGKPAKVIGWGYEEQDSSRVVEEFDKIARTADLIVGKNSAKFDVKMLNSVRMMKGLPGLPDWAMSHDDLERQMRKYFRLPSQSLDYISKHLGFGGKVKMEFDDWVKICEKREDGGKQAYDKMLKYCRKDVEDTRALWGKLSEHFDSKFNNARFQDLGMACKHADCGSVNIGPNGTRMSGGSKYQTYTCRDCGRYCGKTAISATTGKSGVNIK